ncbi:peptide ABC transporter substrate-binding protein [Bdellovibrionota bacterium FG-1]
MGVWSLLARPKGRFWGPIGLLLLLFLLASCRTKTRAPLKEIIRIQLPAEPASLDPALAEDGASLRVLMNTMEGLVGYDGAGNLQNKLAQSYRVSSDGRRYEFIIRPSARWSDGQSVVAADFVTAIRRALHPRSGSKLAGMFFPIRGARSFFEGKTPASSLGVRDEKGKLIIELERVTHYFVEVLTLPVALPEREDILNSHGQKWPDTAPCTGPYRIQRHEIDQRIVFEPNPFYWDTFRKRGWVEFLIIADETTGLHLFEQGKLDILTQVPTADLARLRKQGVIRTDPFFATYYLAFNWRKPPFNDRVWRQAVSGAIRRVELVKALDSGGVVATSWLPPGLEGHIENQDLAQLFAPAIAAVRSQVHGTVNLRGAFDTSQRNSLLMEKIQQDLRATLGIKLSLNNLDWKTYLKTVQTDPPHLFRLGILSPFRDPIQILQSFVTGDPNNYLNWSNQRYDQLIMEISTLPSGPRKVQKLIEAQKLLVQDEAIVVPIYYYVQNHAISSRVVRFRVNPFGVIRFDELEVRPNVHDVPTASTK